jgi:hypothetical protein
MAAAVPIPVCSGGMPDEVIDDILVVAEGTLAGLIFAPRLAIEDSRDLRLRADAARG